MTSTRVYRIAMPVEDAIAELRRFSGSQFHPKVVEAFIEMVEEEGLISS
jgi:HD-GYP domain-containing protein (c-di-GMP phosphodiesterase class II)